MGKTILSYGTFDMFQIGHVKLLQRLAQMGDRLIIGPSTEEFNALKGKKPLFHMNIGVKSCLHADMLTRLFLKTPGSKSARIS